MRSKATGTLPSLVRASVFISLALIQLAPAAYSADDTDCNEAIVQEDIGKILQICKPLAEQGDVAAQFALGSMYSLGQGVPQDTAEAVRWARMAAEQGSAQAQLLLGAMYAEGQGVPQDYAEALKWHRLVAEQGLAEAQVLLGALYTEGAAGVPQDFAEGLKWFRLAAEQGHAIAQAYLGDMYFDGVGVQQDYAEALQWWRLAGEQGLAEAQWNVGAVYTEGAAGVPQDYTEAMKWHRLAAAQGHAGGQFNVGVMYKRGLGVPQDYAEALKWYRLAAEQGLAQAQANVGTMYFDGVGVQQDYAEALKWGRLAAAQGYATAQANLGVMYATGRGVSEDYVLAYMWFDLAANQGYGPSVNFKATLAKEMTPDQIAKAEEMSANWVANASVGQNEAEAAVEVHSGWSVPFDGSDSRPVVHDGVLYVGSFDGAVYAFDVTTGQQKWRYQTGEGLTSGPEIIVTDSDQFLDQLGAAITASEKSQRGKRQVSATPVVLNGVVYIGSEDHYFYALDAASGKVKWRTELGNRVSDAAIVRSQLLVAYAVGIVGTGPLHQVLYVLDPRDGRIKWSTEDEGWATHPALRENVIYFGVHDDYKVVHNTLDSLLLGNRSEPAPKSFPLNAVDLETGRPQWTTQLNGRRPSTPVLSMDTLYVAAFEGGDFVMSPKGVLTNSPTIAHVYAVDPSTGKLLWDFEADKVKYAIPPPLTVGPKHVFLVTQKGLSAVRKSSGELGWFLQGNYSPLTFRLHDSLYVSSGDFAKKDTIFALDPDTGTIIWRASPGTNLYLRSITDDGVYVSDGASLVALKRSDGKKLWRFKTGGIFKEGNLLSAPPTRFGRQLIFSTETSLLWGEDPIKGRLYSIDAETGKLK